MNFSVSESLPIRGTLAGMKTLTRAQLQSRRGPGRPLQPVTLHCVIIGPTIPTPTYADGTRQTTPAGTGDGGTQGGPQRRRGAIRLAAEVEVHQPHQEPAPSLQEALVTTNCRQTAPIPQTGRTPPAIQHQPRSRLVPGTARRNGARKAQRR